MEKPTVSKSGEKDPQERYDEDLLEFTSGDAAETNDDDARMFKGRFTSDFYRYSKDFLDREEGAPGIDQDFGTKISTPPRETVFPKLMPEGDGEAESIFDRRIREEIMDLLSQDSRLDAADVSARVEDGVVTLSGTVHDERMKIAIEENVQLVPGVEEVVDCLILNPVESEHGTDPETLR